MALRNIQKNGEPVLGKKSKHVSRFDSRLALLVGDMKETLKDANGVGLAAPQVGVLKRVIVIDAGGEAGAVELVNPEITEREGEQVYYEGCLSYPGYFGNVGRPESLTVRASDAYGEGVAYRATGIYAVACCHEADHLEGEMFMKKVKGPLYTLEEVKELREKDRAERGAAAKKEAAKTEKNAPVGKSAPAVRSPGAGENGDNGGSGRHGDDENTPEGLFIKLDL